MPLINVKFSVQENALSAKAHSASSYIRISVGSVAKDFALSTLENLDWKEKIYGSA